jgi:hypothetical protein
VWSFIHKFVPLFFSSADKGKQMGGKKEGGGGGKLFHPLVVVVVNLLRAPLAPSYKQQVN